MRLKYILATAVLTAFGFTVQNEQANAGRGEGTTNSPAACSQSGHWIGGPDGEVMSRQKLFQELSTRPLVLLGESHDNASHHRWQLHTLSALLGRSKELVIGFEMFPRAAQPVLDQWVAGALTEKEFLEKSDWRRVWGYDPDLYMPLFQFARMHRVPMVALNVDRKLVSRVAEEGWTAIPTEDRHGISDPVPAQPEYRRALADVYRTKLSMMAKGHFKGMASMSKPPKADAAPSLDDVMKKPDFDRFVDAQLVWDRAMAEGLHDAKQKHPSAMVVGVMGSGHLTYRHGVPRQLNQLGTPGSAVLIPAQMETACQLVQDGYADALFTVEAGSDSQDEPKKRLRLGVRLSDDEGSILIQQVVPGSVAEATKLREGDRIVRAAGVAITTTGALVDVIAKQVPGFWLPLIVERSGETLELVAKFPAST